MVKFEIDVHCYMMRLYLYSVYGLYSKYRSPKAGTKIVFFVEIATVCPYHDCFSFSWGIIKLLYAYISWFCVFLFISLYVFYLTNHTIYLKINLIKHEATTDIAVGYNNVGSMYRQQARDI